MTIVEQFIDQNEQLLDQLTAENPSLGGAIAEALAVIDFYAKSNNVEFDDKRKEELLASPVAEVVEIKQEPQMKEVLKKIDEVVAESTPTMPVVESEEMKWVVDTTSEAYANQLFREIDRQNNPAELREANGRYYIIADKKINEYTTANNFLKILISGQIQLPISEIDKITQPPATIEVTPEITPPSAETTMPTIPEAHTPTAPIVHESKEFVEDDILVSAEDLEALKQLEDLEDLTDINLDDLDI